MYCNVPDKPKIAGTGGTLWNTVKFRRIAPQNHSQSKVLSSPFQTQPARAFYLRYLNYNPNKIPNFTVEMNEEIRSGLLPVTHSSSTPHCPARYLTIPRYGGPEDAACQQLTAKPTLTYFVNLQKLCINPNIRVNPWISIHFFSKTFKNFCWNWHSNDTSQSLSAEKVFEFLMYWCSSTHMIQRDSPRARVYAMRRALSLIRSIRGMPVDRPRYRDHWPI